MPALVGAPVSVSFDFHETVAATAQKLVQCELSYEVPSMIPLDEMGSATLPDHPFGINHMFGAPTVGAPLFLSAGRP